MDGIPTVTTGEARRADILRRLALAERWDMSDHESADSYRYDRYNAGM